MGVSRSCIGVRFCWLVGRVGKEKETLEEPFGEGRAERPNASLLHDVDAHTCSGWSPEMSALEVSPSSVWPLQGQRTHPSSGPPVPSLLSELEESSWSRRYLAHTIKYGSLLIFIRSQTFWDKVDLLLQSPAIYEILCFMMGEVNIHEFY